MTWALLIDCYANGIFSPRSIEWATYRDIGMRYLTASIHAGRDRPRIFQRLRTDSTPPIHTRG